MQEVLDAIWKTYSIAGMLAFQVNQSIFTDFSYSQKPRYVNINEVLVPILQLREYQEKMELFSTNDLDPREFERYGEHIFAESEPSSENFALMRKRGVEQLQEYRSILEQFSGSPFFDEFLSAEKRWYQAVELLYMTLAILPGVVWVDDHNSLIEEYRNSAHADAMYELRKLVYGENNYSELGQERGDSIEVERWGQVRIGFSRHESIQYLNVVGANKLFADATSADDESIQLASLIASEEILTTLRTLREEVMIMVRGYQLNTMFINE